MLVKVLDGKRSTYRYKDELRNKGFRYSSEPIPHWEGDVSEDKLFEIENWCFARKLSLITHFSKRSVDYRKSFFKENAGNFGEGRYLCAYCGRILKKENVTVDHLISVNKVQSSKRYICLVRRLGFKNVNDIRNLVPSCKHCNSRKGSKGGLWIVKGFLGRYRTFWLIFWSVALIIILFFIYLFLTRI